MIGKFYFSIRILYTTYLIRPLSLNGESIASVQSVFFCVVVVVSVQQPHFQLTFRSNSLTESSTNQHTSSYYQIFNNGFFDMKEAKELVLGKKNKSNIMKSQAERYQATSKDHNLTTIPTEIFNAVEEHQVDVKNLGFKPNRNDSKECFGITKW